MKCQIQLWRGEELVGIAQAPNMERAYVTVDKFTTSAHNGVLGIGTFSLFIYETAPEGHIERCIKQFEPFKVPLREMETA